MPLASMRAEGWKGRKLQEAGLEAAGVEVAEVVVVTGVVLAAEGSQGGRFLRENGRLGAHRGRALVDLSANMVLGLVICIVGNLALLVNVAARFAFRALPIFSCVPN